MFEILDVLMLSQDIKTSKQKNSNTLLELDSSMYAANKNTLMKEVWEAIYLWLLIMAKDQQSAW